MSLFLWSCRLANAIATLQDATCRLVRKLHMPTFVPAQPCLVPGNVSNFDKVRQYAQTSSINLFISSSQTSLDHAAGIW